MTAYSSTLNLRMKDLYDKNYYTPQLPMRTFRNPYFLPTSNQLLFDILKKQSKSATAAAAPAAAAAAASATSAASAPIPPSTTGPRRKTGPGKETIPPTKASKPTAAQTAESAKAAKIQDAFNKSVAAQKARQKAAAAAQGGKVFSAPPIFKSTDTLSSKLAKMEGWKASQPSLPALPKTDKEDRDLALGNKKLKELKNQKFDQRFKPLAMLPNKLAAAKSALANTIATQPTRNSRLSEGQQSATYKKWKREKEDLEDVIKKLSSKGGGKISVPTGQKKIPPKDTGAASKPIEKAGKQGDKTKLTDAATVPRFAPDHKPTSQEYPSLTSTQLTTLAALYKTWKSDQLSLAVAKSRAPTLRRSTKDKAKFVATSLNKIKEVKSQILTLEGKGR